MSGDRNGNSAKLACHEAASALARCIRKTPCWEQRDNPTVKECMEDKETQAICDVSLSHVTDSRIVIHALSFVI